jgi:hypothetical protein
MTAEENAAASEASLIRDNGPLEAMIGRVLEQHPGT